MNGFAGRLRALVKKEVLQLVRDNSSLFIGILVPLLLIFLIGYGMSMDVKDIPVAVVLEDSSPIARSMAAKLDGSDYFRPYYVHSLREAERLMDERTVDAIITVPGDFTAALYAGHGKVQVLLHGVDAATANTIRAYAEGVLRAWAMENAAALGLNPGGTGLLTVENRLWFNDANTSTWYFVPGIIVMIVTIVGVFLTALVMAREWEYGTLESLFVTPVQPREILLAKTIPYFVNGMLGFLLCLLAAKHLYAVPVQGSLLLIVLSSMIYMIVTLGIGLTISSTVKNQFVASQLAMVLTLMPSMMLTGFIFDLRSAPLAVNIIGHLLPATYYLELLKTLFLAGNNWRLILHHFMVLLIYASVFIGTAIRVTKKRVE